MEDTHGYLGGVLENKHRDEATFIAVQMSVTAGDGRQLGPELSFQLHVRQLTTARNSSFSSGPMSTHIYMHKPTQTHVPFKKT